MNFATNEKSVDVPSPSPLAYNIKSKQQFDFYAPLRQWNNMGYRIVVKTPYISDDETPLFGIKVTPTLPYTFDGAPRSLYIQMMQNLPIFPLPHYGVPFPEEPAVTVTRFMQPPLLGMLSHFHRDWSGGLKYRIRAVSSFQSSGCLYVGILRDEYHSGPDCTIDSFGSHILPDDDAFLPEFTNREIDGCADPHNIMAEAHTVIDPSMFRHMEIEVPYQKMNPAVDIIQEKDFPSSMAHDYIIVRNSGTLSTGDQRSTITFEVDIAAGDDFRFNKELGPMCLVSLAELKHHTLNPFTYPKPHEPVLVEVDGSPRCKREHLTNANGVTEVCNCFGDIVLG